MTALDCKAYLSKMQPLSASFFTKIVYTWPVLVYNYGQQIGGSHMGIHYDYKSTRGAKKMQKQQEREQRRRGRKTTPTLTQSSTEETKPLTLDMITDPNK